MRAISLTTSLEDVARCDLAMRRILPDGGGLHGLGSFPHVVFGNVFHCCYVSCCRIVVCASGMYFRTPHVFRMTPHVFNPRPTTTLSLRKPPLRPFCLLGSCMLVDLTPSGPRARGAMSLLFSGFVFGAPHVFTPLILES